MQMEEQEKRDPYKGVANKISVVPVQVLYLKLNATDRKRKFTMLFI